MEWLRLRGWASTRLIDATDVVAFRIAARCLPLLSERYRRDVESKNKSTPIVLSTLRALIATKAFLNSGKTGLQQERTSALLMASKQIANFDTSIRAATHALKLTLTPPGGAKIEALRQVVQAATDGFANTKRFQKTIGYNVDLIAEISHDVDFLDGGRQLPPNVIEITSWVYRENRSLQGYLRFFDQYWDPWIDWINYILLGIDKDLIGDESWLRFETRVALIPERMWHGDIIELNVHIGEIYNAILEESRVIAPPEAQTISGVRFRVSEDGVVEIDESEKIPYESQKTLEEIMVLLAESTAILIQSCKGNSEARLRDTLIEYQANFQKLNRLDGRIRFVTKGEVLRNTLRSQKSLTADSDSPVMRPETVEGLSELIAQHNVLCNFVEDLQILDRSSQDPSEQSSPIPRDKVVSMLSSPETKRILSPSALEVLSDLSEDALRTSSPNIILRTAESFRNLVRAIFDFLWNRRATITKIGAAPAAVFGVGKWAVVNQAAILAFFPAGSGMATTISRILELLNKMPLS